MTSADRVRLNYDQKLESLIQERVRKAFPKEVPEEVKKLLGIVVDARVNTLIALKGQEQ